MAARRLVSRFKEILHLRLQKSGMSKRQYDSQKGLEEFFNELHRLEKVSANEIVALAAERLIDPPTQREIAPIDRIAIFAIVLFLQDVHGARLSERCLKDLDELVREDDRYSAVHEWASLWFP